MDAQASLKSMFILDLDFFRDVELAMQILNSEVKKTMQ